MRPLTRTVRFWGDRKMNSKQKKVAYRIIVAAALAAVILILELFVSEKFEWFMLIPYIIAGYDVLIKAFKNIRNVIDENFLMAIATIGALILLEFTEAMAVMLFYQVGELFNSIAVGKSRKSIQDLMDIKPDIAHRLVGEETEDIACEEVNVGDILVVKPGERIPADGVVIEGKADADTSSITGESLYRELSEGSDAISGFVNINGILKIKVTKSFEDSTVAKILDLVENASSKKAETEKFITRFARVYTPVVVLLAIIIAVIPPFFSEASFGEWLHRSLSFLVVSCPCALVISVPLGFFGALGCASKNGILIKGSNYIEQLAHLDCAVFDKTGTLTVGKPSIDKVYPNGITDRDLLFTAAIAQKNSNHPISRAVVELFDTIPACSDFTQVGGRGVKCSFNGKTISCGNLKMMNEMNIDVPEAFEGTVMYVALDNNYLGAVLLKDTVKETSKNAIRLLKDCGIKLTVMLTGDSKASAEKIGEEVGIDLVKSELLPDGKVEEFEKLIVNYDSVAFVGDGINDAPVIARADVGVAMGALGSDAAIEACDVVIMNDDPSLLAKAVKISRKALKIVWQNIFFAIGVKLAIMVLVAVGLASMWEAVFADVGVAVLAILNSMRMLRK